MLGKSRIAIIISIVALGLMLGALIMVASGPAMAEVSTDGNYHYQFVSDGVEITSYNGTDHAVTIPSNIDGFQVTSIGAWAFANNTGLTGVTIPDNVNTIGDNAFTDSTSLIRIEFKGNAPTIGENWVSGITGLTVYYGYGATGFSGPSWQGINLVALCDLVMSANFGTTSAGGIFDQGSAVTISASAPAPVAGERYVWSQWVGTGTGSYNGNEQTHTITIGSDITQHAVWTKQYEVTFATPIGGSTSPGPGTNWYDAGSLPVQASPSSGYAFSSWSSDDAQITFTSPSSASTTASIGGSGTITATFTQVSVGVTITSSPAGPGYILVDGDPTTTPQTFDWSPGSSHTLTATASVAISSNEQYAFTSWSDSGARVHTIAAPATSETFTANFAHQYLVTIVTNGGTTTPSAGTHWYTAGSQVTLLDATAPIAGVGVQYVWNGWTGSGTGSYTGNERPATNQVTVSGPITETADWNLRYQLTMEANVGTTVPSTGSWYDAGTQVSLAAAHPTAVTGEQYLFSSWAGSGTGSYDGTSNPATNAVTMNGPITETATWTHQYLLTTGSNFGTVTPSTGTWHNAGTTVSLTATAPASASGERYSSLDWTGTGSGAYSGTNNPGSITMNGPITETANWAHQYQLITVSTIGTVDPATGSWYSAGATVTLTATHPTAVTGEQYLFNSWTGSGTGSYSGTSNPATNLVTMNGPITETAAWGHQYMLTVSTNFGTVQPSIATWYNIGTQVSITAVHPTTAAGERYLFTTWAGTGSGSYSGTSNPATNLVTMNGPISEAASWNHQYQLTMGANFGTVAPSTGSWYNAGTTVTLTATHPIAVTGEQYLFTTWTGTGSGSYSGTSNPATNLVTMNGPISETAIWAHQYQVSFVVSPPGGGTINPAGSVVWENAGPLSIQAVPSSGYAYSSWASDTSQITFDAQSASTAASIAGSGTITATFSVLPVGVTITSSPTGTGFVLVDGMAVVTPRTFTWLPGETHTLEAVATVTTSANERNEFMSWSDHGVRVHSFQVTTATVTVTANFAHQYLVTLATSGGTTTPAAGTHWYNASSKLTLDALAPSAGTGVQYVWKGWTGSGTGSYTGTDRQATNAVTVSGSITETASWTKQYLLSFVSSPSIGGTTSPAGGIWENAGPLPILANASPGYAFATWSSSTGSITFNAQTASTTAVIGAPGTITGTFALQPVGVTITSGPIGTGYVLVDGVATVTPSTFSWLPGSIHTLEASANATGGAGERYSFTTWSDAGARFHSYTVTAATTVTANFAHQYLVTMLTSSGTTTPAAGPHWYDAGSKVTLDAISATAGTGTRYVWKDWTGTGAGSYTGTTKLATSAVTINGPITETASWTKQYQISFVVTPAAGGTTTPAGTGLWYDAGSIPIQATPAKDYAFSSWTSGSSSITFKVMNASTTASINGPGTITANFVLALGITITSSPTGSGYVLVDGGLVITPANFKWSAGEIHSIQAVSTVLGVSGERFVFNSWSDVGARTHNYTVTALTATVIANFDHHYLLTMKTDIGTTTPSAGGNGIWETAGSKIAINAVAPSVASVNERYQWVGWTGFGSGNVSGIDGVPAVDIMMNGPITETAGWSHQYLVTVTTNYGTTEPAAGSAWFVDGSSIYLNASSPIAGAGERYIFNGWTGTGIGSYSGMANPVTSVISVKGPVTETASWTRQQMPDAPGGFMANSSDGLINLNWTAPSDGGLAIDYYAVYQDGAPVSHVTTLNTTVSGLTNGQTYSFTVSAHNLLGSGPNSTTAVIKPMPGPNSLILEITSPEAGSYHQAGSVLLEWTVSDLSSSVVRTEVSLDGTNWSTVTGTSQWMDGLRDGNDYLLVRATDAANNVLTRIIRIIVDTTPPIVNVTAPKASAILNSQTVTVSWRITEQVSGLAKIEMSSDGLNWLEQTGNTGSLTVPDGAVAVWVRATDNAGNDMIAIVPFTVDTVAPTMLTHTPTGSAESTLASVTVTFNEAMNRTSSTVSINGILGKIAWEGDNLTFTPSEALMGKMTYSVTVNGVDLAGNPSRENWTFQTAAVGKVSGVLYGHDGNVLPNTIVRLVSLSSAAQTEMGHFSLAVSSEVDKVRETTSDANGAFAFYDVPIGNYTVEFTEKGYVTKSTEVSMTAAAVAAGGLTVEPGSLSIGQGNGLVFLLVVGAVSAALAGGIILIGRYRTRPRNPGAGPVTVQSPVPEKAPENGPGSNVPAMPEQNDTATEERGNGPAP